MGPEYFFIIGAQRCGTTYLYQLLDQHPEIEMARPLRPEPKFFLVDSWQGGESAYAAAHFGHKPGATLRGEKTTSYIEHPEVAARINAMLPAARFICLVREPADRAFSNYLFTRQHGLEPLTFEAALQMETERLAQDHDATRFVSPYAYAQRGHYIDYLEDYLEHVPTERLLVVVQERLVSEPQAFADVLRFLGRDPAAPVQDRDQVVNAARGRQDPGVPPSPEVFSSLRARYRDSNRRLAERFGLDLSVWEPSDAL